MIFVTLGSQMFQFNRLLKKIDLMINEGLIKEEVYAQTGYSDYEPLNYQYKKFLDRNEFSNIISRAEIVITHGGTGTIISAVKNGKKVIAIPRLAKYGEHVDDHQLQLLKQFDGMGIIKACFELDELGEIFYQLNNTKFVRYKSNTEIIINSIDKYLNKLSRIEGISNV